ncbi:outer membrane beta-barrel protein, partial [Sphingobacterium sp.]|uniref:outer membrane beta-barrel protein n=1 Tax=Sphingobacterium sp. TaxID=341027 RepID=UPI0028A0849D
GRDMYVSGEQLASILRGLQASEVAKLELMSNPSAREDAAGTAGIINIVTKRNGKVGFGGDAFVRAGQGRKFYGGFGGGLHYKVNGLDMYVQGTTSYDRNKSHNLTERSFFNQGSLTSFQRQHENKQLDDASFHSVRAGAKYEFSDGGILDGSVHWMKGNYQPYASISMDTWTYPANEPTARALSNNRFDETFKNWTFNVNYINKYEGEDHFLKINFDFAPHGNDYNNRFETDQFNLQNNTKSSIGRTNVQDLSNTTYAGRLDYSKPLTDSSRIELGWKGTYFFINNDVINTV